MTHVLAKGDEGRGRGRYIEEEEDATTTTTTTRALQNCALLAARSSQRSEGLTGDEEREGGWSYHGVVRYQSFDETRNRIGRVHAEDVPLRGIVTRQLRQRCLIDDGNGVTLMQQARERESEREEWGGQDNSARLYALWGT